jgi:endoglucanase
VLLAGVLAVGVHFQLRGSITPAQACDRQAAALSPAGQDDAVTVDPRYAPSPFVTGSLWTPPYAGAEQAAADADRSDHGAEAARFRRLAATPRAVWYADPGRTGADLTAAVAGTVGAAVGRHQVPVLVAYAIPLRDCGGESAGGTSSAAAYRTWIAAFAAGLRAGGAGQGTGVAVVLEPDALGLLDRLPADRQQERLGLLRDATTTLAAVDGVAVYLDAGHSSWVPVDQMRSRLVDAGVAGARGFALNVANFRLTSLEVGYGQQLAGLLGGKSFVVDTSRNGHGPTDDDRWCNPPGRALGTAPQLAAGGPVDAYLWVKSPGESDGACGGGAPAAGVFWPSYADDLTRGAGW